MASESTVSTTHPEYDDNIEKWQKVDDVIKGDVTKYLRNVGKNEPKPENSASRQLEYEEGAILDNFSQKTLTGLTGAAFMKPATVELQSNLAYLEEDIDGVGTTLEQQAKDAVDQDLRKARLGLLADMPTQEKGRELSISDNQDPIKSPRIHIYYAQSIINWRYRRIGSAQKLELVVLTEEINKDKNDIFTHETETQYRVLALDEEGFYYQQVYDSDGNPQEPVYPQQAGSNMTEIPFFFVGVSSNTATVDASPVYPIVELNLGHFRNSADTEENSFVCSQAMLVLALSEQISAAEWKKENPEGVKIGSRRGLNVGPGGSAQFIQAEESDKAMRLMEMKKQQAVELGAQIITPSQQVTAETARIQQSVNHSVLSAVTTNVTRAYRDALAQCAAFLGTEYTSTVKINQDFYFSILSAQDKAQWVTEIMQGVTPRAFYYQKLREAGEIPEEMDNDEIQALLDEQGPTMGFGIGFGEVPPNAEEDNQDDNVDDNNNDAE